MINYDTLIPYKEIEYNGITYSNCEEYSHVSRYRCLRTVNHVKSDRKSHFISLETPNNIHANIEVIYYIVRAEEENRLDIISNKYLGSAEYTWVLSYINEIHDGYTVHEGQKIMIPASKSVTALFETGEMLASVNPLLFNLGEE